VRFDDGQWYKAEIKSYSAERGRLEAVYEDGDMHWHLIDEETAMVDKCYPFRLMSADEDDEDDENGGADAM
jgi:hypothetical protein